MQFWGHFVTIAPSALKSSKINNLGEFLAEAVRFELTDGGTVAGFQDQSIQPLWHTSIAAMVSPQTAILWSLV